MPITAADIKLLASARMVDADDGGGPMTGTGLQDGLENNVFPDISSTDLAFGRLALRKVWPAVLNAGTDTLMGAHVIIDDVPGDANVGAFALLGTSATEDRAGVRARLEQSHWEASSGVTYVWSFPARTRIKIPVSATAAPQVGHVFYFQTDTAVFGSPVLLLTVTEIPFSDGSFSEGFGSMDSGDRVFAVTYDGSAPVSPFTGARMGVPAVSTPRLAATRPVTGTLSAGAAYCDVDTLLVGVVPKHLGVAAGSAAQIGIDGAAMAPAGAAVAVRAGDGLVVHHTGEVAAATYANGNTVNVGRTGIANFRLVGANGVSITTGWTGNLSTGVVTISDISGWSQPVRVRHTIEEVLACSRTGYPELSGGSTGAGSSEATAPFTLTAGLTMYCGRPNVGSIRVISRTGQDITDQTFPVIGGNARLFGINLSAGTALFSSASDPAVTAAITSFSPVSLVSSGTYASPGGASAPGAVLNRVTFNRPLARAFPSGTLLSSMLLLGDLQARTGAAFSQESWGNVWADARIGSAIAAQYQDVAYPIAVSNRGAISERWALIFLTATTFRVVGQTTGQIAVGDVNSTLAPLNPATSTPYFTLNPAGWGTWAAGNVLRFNTRGANAPVWVGRTVKPAASVTAPDTITVATRGDLDA